MEILRRRFFFFPSIPDRRVFSSQPSFTCRRVSTPRRPIRLGGICQGKKLPITRRMGSQVIVSAKWITPHFFQPFRLFFRGRTPVRGLMITMVLNHLQVLESSKWASIEANHLTFTKGKRWLVKIN